ncbi:MAG TPA: hypothetical protein VIH42_00930 [Thermoguttaceae bacterium]
MDASIWQRLLSEDILGVLIPIIAILAVAIVIIIKKIFEHRERMAMIERGMHPDFPVEEEGTDQNPRKTS